jgi:hypothetical protein
MRTRTLLLASFLGLVTVAATVTTIAVATAAANTYEAESSANTLAGGARVANCGPCSGGRKVGYVGNNAGTLQFNGVSASAAGSATITISYASGTTRNASLSVNGGAATSLSFASTGSFTTVKTKTVTVTLKAGTNTLKFLNASGWAPDFDKIVVSSGGGGGGGGPTAAELLAKVTGCNQISHGTYKTDSDSGSATVPVCGKTGAVFWKSDMDIDCDGQRTTQCNENTDCCFQNDTAFHQSDGKPLNSAALPYLVVPSSSGIWNYASAGVHGASVAAVIYHGKVTYAVVGDTGPTGIIGEGSYALAVSLGIDPDPSTGGVDSGVTFIVFTGTSSIVSPIENHAAATNLGEQLARQFINTNN